MGGVRRLPIRRAELPAEGGKPRARRKKSAAGSISALPRHDPRQRRPPGPAKPPRARRKDSDMIDGVMRDVRYGFRTLRRDSGLTGFVVLIVGLGIGLASTVFNVFNALLIRPLPFDEPSRLVWIANGTSENLSAQTVQVLNLQGAPAIEGPSFTDVAGILAVLRQRRHPHHRRRGAGRRPGVPVTENFLPAPRRPPASSAGSSPPKSPALARGEDGRAQPMASGSAGYAGRSRRHRPLRSTLDGLGCHAVVVVLPISIHFVVHLFAREAAPTSSSRFC